MPVGPAGLRRTHYASLATIVGVLAFAAAVFAVTIGARFNAVFDLTATRAHQLSPRTQNLLEAVDTPVEIMLSVPLGDTDPEAMGRVTSVLENLTRRSNKVSVRFIDTQSEDAADELREAVERLAELDAPEIEEHRRVMSDTVSVVAAAAAGMGDVVDAVGRVGAALGGDKPATLDDRMVQSRAMAGGLALAAATIEDAATARAAGVELPDVRGALEAVAPIDVERRQRTGPLGDAIAELRLLRVWARDRVAVFARQRGNDAALDAANDVADLAGALADDLASAADRLTRLAPLEPLQLARVLESFPAVLVVSERRSTAIRFEALFPTMVRAEGDGADTPSAAESAFRGEELISIAISTVGGGEPPIVVVVHGEAAPAFDAQGGLTNIVSATMSETIDRWRVQRYDVVEWATGLTGDPPDLTQLNPSGVRPVVWFVAGQPTLWDALARGDLAAREQRAEALGSAVSQLINRRENLLVVLGPSTRPSIGGDDPLGVTLRGLGIEARVGNPLIRRIQQPPNRQFFSMHHDVSPPSEPPSGEPASAQLIAETVRGLRTTLHWPMPLELDHDRARATDIELTPLLEVDADRELWGESQWLATGLRSFDAVGDLRPVGTPRRPTPGDRRDLAGGPWIVAASAERTNTRPRGTANTEASQRVAVVSAPEWYQNPYLSLARVIDGRTAVELPGNAELIDAAVSWCAHRDDLIAPSPRTRDIARLSPELSEGTISAMKWTLSLGVPLSVLIIGGVVLLRRR